MSISIVEYGIGEPECVFVQQVDDEEMEVHKLAKDKALKLMWELVLAGAKKTVQINQFDRHINRREAYIFLDH